MVTNLPSTSGTQETNLDSPLEKKWDCPPHVGFPIPPLFCIKPTLIDSSVTSR